MYTHMHVRMHTRKHARTHAHTYTSPVVMSIDEPLLLSFPLSVNTVIVYLIPAFSSLISFCCTSPTSSVTDVCPASYLILKDEYNPDGFVHFRLMKDCPMSPRVRFLTFLGTANTRHEHSCTWVYIFSYAPGKCITNLNIR